MTDQLTDPPTDQPPAVAAARALVLHLARLGVRDVVLAPGSRSAPLAYAVAAAAEGGLIDLHVRVDERTAAFLAVGLSRGSELDGHGRPVAVVTTSGTAVANLHPAVLEAHHRGVPLVVLSADRPAEKRGTGANQTTEQVGIFAGAVRYEADVPAPAGHPGEVVAVLATATRAVAAGTGARTGIPGPVHLNLAYRPPLTPSSQLAPLRGTPADLDAAMPANFRPTRIVPAVTAPVDDHGAGPVPVAAIVVAGDGAGPIARQVAEARGWPLIAEPTSGAAGGPNLVPAAALLLPAVAADTAEVVVFGRPTLTRPVQQLLANPAARLTIIAPGAAPWPDEWANASVVLPGVPTAWLAGPRPADEGPRDRWVRWGRAAAAAVRDATDGQDPTGWSVARALLRASAPDDVLVVGASSPIRDLDLVLGVDDIAPPTILANRGVAGIDGTVSTAIGVALAVARGGRRTRALMGDLTFLHDVGGLLRGPAEPPVDLQILVVNDDGGSIFTTLEPGALAGLDRPVDSTGTGAGHRPLDPVFERVFATPHGADLAALCAGYGIAHRRVDSISTLGAALAEWKRGIEVIEVRVDRAGRRSDYLELAGRVAAAVSAPATD